MIALAKPRRIKASHRRRRRGASDHLLYILNNPFSGTDPTGYKAEVQDCHSASSAGSCTYTETGSRIKKEGTIGSDANGNAKFVGPGAVGGNLITSTGSISAHGNVNGASGGQSATGAGSRKEQAAASSEKNAATNASTENGPQTAQDGLPAPAFRSALDSAGRKRSVDDNGSMIPLYPSVDSDRSRSRSFKDNASRFLGDMWDTLWEKVLPAIPGEGPVAAGVGGLFYKVPYYSRAIKASDLGVKGSTTLLRGNYVFSRGVITIRVDMIRGNYGNSAWTAIPKMIENARKAGGNTLIIEGTLGNSTLQRVLQRLGAEITTDGAVDRIVFSL